ncbi:MAG: ABC transporter ATP-binding protein [Candidatus Absconditabacteria bacterium]|nr:ABC transporter ATP-binding protein [Candidatus Absconditabacteria bacterium]
MTEKRFFFPLIILRISLTFIGLLPAIYFKEIINALSGSIGGDKNQIFAVAIGLLLTILWIKLTNVVLYRAGDFMMINMSVNIMKKIYLECFDYVHRHSFRFFANNFTGSLIKKINKFVGSYDMITDTITFELSPIILNLIFILVIIGLQDRRLSLIMFVWFVVYAVIQYFLYKRNYPYEIKANEQDSKISGVLSDTITNNFNIKVFSTLKREYKDFESQITFWSKLQKKRRYRAMLIRSITGLMMGFIEFIVFYMALKYWSYDTITIGFFVLLQMYLLRLMDQLWGIGNVFRHLYRGFSESAEMLEILDEQHEVQDSPNAKSLKVHQGAISFDKVGFAYEGESAVFSNLSFRVKPGEKVAFVGESGAGKTSIIKLLFRFFDIQNGKILIDDQDISTITQESLRNSISLVPQDPVLFHRSIKENIAYGNPQATDEQIIAASKMARCHDFIIKLNDGYDTLVGERGIKLSGGERQRVAIARAILENKSILALDEATSALDSESEKLIQEAMDEVMRSKTVIVIAHRLSTVMKMDRIIVMDAGKIIEDGSHRELLTNKNGIYKKLRDIQSGGFEK